MSEIGNGVRRSRCPGRKDARVGLPRKRVQGALNGQCAGRVPGLSPGLELRHLDRVLSAYSTTTSVARHLAAGRV